MKYLFSIICFAIALAIPIYAIVAAWLLTEDIYYYTTTTLNLISPMILLVMVGIINLPKKGNGN